MPTEAAIAATYEDVEEIIHTICKTFMKRYGRALGDMEEVRSTANLYFMLAYHSYDRSEDFIHWVRLRVYSGLVDQMRRKINEPMKRVDGFCLELLPYPEREPFEVPPVDRLGMQVLDLSLNMPETLKRMAVKLGGTPRCYRTAMREYFRGLGWPRGVISRTFNQVRRAIKTSNRRLK